MARRGLCERLGRVRRNPKLAVALICHGSDVPAELIDMVRLPG